MKTMVNCPNWNDYEGLNGMVTFCSAGAYGKKLTAEEARNYGCTVLERENCLKMMVANGGFGLVPEITAAVPTGTEKVERETILGMIG